MIQILCALVIAHAIYPASNQKSTTFDMPVMLKELHLRPELFSDNLEKINREERATMSKKADEFIKQYVPAPCGIAYIQLEMRNDSLQDLLQENKNDAQALFGLVADLKTIQRAYLNMKIAKTCNPLNDRITSCLTFENIFYTELIDLLTGLTDVWFARTQYEHSSNTYFEKNKNIKLNENIPPIIKAGTAVHYLIYAIIQKIDPEVFALLED